VYHYHPDPYYYVDGRKKWMGHRLIIERARRGLDIEIWGDCSKIKSYVYVYDCAQLIKKALESSSSGDIYNLANIAPISLEEQILGIAEVFCSKSKQSKIIYRPDKPYEREHVMDITKSRRELFYNPQWDYLRLLQDMKEKMECNHFSKLWGVFEDYEDKDLTI